MYVHIAEVGLISMLAGCIEKISALGPSRNFRAHSKPVILPHERLFTFSPGNAEFMFP